MAVPARCGANSTGEAAMEKKNGYPAVDPDYVCSHFSRVFWSLIEEPDVCPNCEYYDEDGGCCRCEENRV